MKDAKGKEIKPGQTARRIVSKAVMEVNSPYNKYTIRLKKWNLDDDTEVLVADAGFLTELLDADRAREFEVTDV